MNPCKLVCLLVTLIITYLLLTKCSTEGFGLKCEDDPTWIAEDRGGGKHYCKDIGATASCYDRDLGGREGWERCLKTCGNCAKTEVSQAPMNILATFSGEPYETFGKVPSVSKDRQWVGKGVGGGGKGGKGSDVRGYIDEDLSEDITDLQSRLDSVQDVFNMITGNVKKCKLPGATDLAAWAKKNPGKQSYKACNNKVLPCPKGDPSEPHDYIKQVCDDADGDNCSIQFPTYNIQCGNVASILKGKKNQEASKCNQYYLFDQIGDDKKTGDKKKDKKKDKKTDDKLTLGDVCPIACKKCK